MKLKTPSIEAKGRFAALLDRWHGGSAMCDQALMETNDWLVAPTLGAIVPNWLIAIPRRPALNFKSWQGATGTNPSSIMARVAAHLGVPDERILWFEHGPHDVGTVVGCGVDYAHLHILFDPVITLDALMDQVRKAAKLAWSSSEPDLAYRKISGDQSYLVVGSGRRAFLAESVDTTGSQFLRRMVAATAGCHEGWNYKSHPHPENIALTVAAFRSRAQVAALGG